MTTLVIGGTGNVGRAVVQDLVRHGGDVRVLTRDLDHARRLLGPEPQLVVGVLGDARARERAFAGVTRLFLAMANHRGQVAEECAAIAEARMGGVQRIVKLSGPAPAHDSSLFIERWHAQIEQYLWASGIPAAALRPSTFATNLLAFAEPVMEQGVLPAPTAGARVAFVDPADVGAVGAAVLTDPSFPARRTVRVTGPAALSYESVAAAWSSVLGRAVAFVPVTEEDARAAMAAAGLPEDMIEAYLAVYRLQRAGAFAEVSQTVPAWLGRPAGSVEQFLADHHRTGLAAVQRAGG